MIDTQDVEHARLKARRKVVESILRAEPPREVWQARQQAKLTLPAAPAMVVWEEVVRLLGKDEDYRQQVEVELAKFENDCSHLEGSES